MFCLRNVSSSTFCQAILKFVWPYLKVSSAWEVLPIFMEVHSHNPISRVKGFFHSVTVMNINVNVEHSGMVSLDPKRLFTINTRADILEQLQYGKYNVIDVTEPRSFRLFCVVQATSPVNR